MRMTISSYSVTNAVIMYNIALLLIYFLRRSPFALRRGTQALLFAAALTAIRLLAPMDFPYAHIIPSKKVMPAVKDALGIQPFSSVVDVTVGHFLLLAWIIGTCFFACKYISSTYAAMRLRKSYAVTENAQAQQAARRLGLEYPVLVSPQVLTPHAAGFFRPVICLPDLKLSTEDWEYILRHEAQHIKSHDVWIKLFYAALEAVMWWNPVSHLFMRELDDLLELRCDAALAENMSGSERLEYLETILRVVKSSAADSPEAMSVCFARRERCMRDRFEAVLNLDKHAGRWARRAVIAAVLAVFCLSYTVLIQPYYRPPLGSAVYDALDEDKDEDEMFILFDGEKYYFCSYGRLRYALSAAELAREPYSTVPIYGSNQRLR